MVFIIKELDSSALPVLQAVSWLHRYCCSSRCQEAMYLSGTIWRFPEEAEQFIAFLEIQVTEDHAKVNTLADLIMTSLFFKSYKTKRSSSTCAGSNISISIQPSF